MIELREYVDDSGRRPFAEWFDGLNAPAAAKVTITLARIEQGNLASTRSVGAGVHEGRIDFGPGYRIYFGSDGERLVILLGGGTKSRQQADIRRARALWQDYKRRKRSQD